MKKIFAIVALMSMSFLHLEAQTFMVNAIVPKERSKCNISKSNESAFVLGGYKVKGGFTLGSPSGGLVADNVPGKAVFNITGAYSKITFLLGPSFGPMSSKSNSIVTLSADGKRLLDEVVFAYDSPKFYTFDVTGVNELVFTVPRGSQDISFGNVKLWKAGVAVSNPCLLYTSPSPRDS